MEGGGAAAPFRLASARATLTASPSSGRPCRAPKTDVTQIPLHDLRRVAGALDSLRGRSVASAHMRADLRQLRLELEDGTLVVIGLGPDSSGKARLEVDVVRRAVDQHQLEVRFEAS